MSHDERVEIRFRVRSVPMTFAKFRSAESEPVDRIKVGKFLRREGAMKHTVVAAAATCASASALSRVVHDVE